MSTCRAEAALEVLVGKWTHKILYQLIMNPKMRFNELRRAIPGITQKMLTAQLRDLEAQDIVERKVYAEVPPRVEYSLTEYANSLIPILEAMDKWGKNHKIHLENKENKEQQSSSM
ncbi:winged helix-turn-helix transcriptional regulator [Alkalihalobacillus pseudalcaliphilus]|uniref:winged helix-turn-helix transcriptional regulator n=1 Tax=Alkalihalobacillus pseudalcaliphilus TaxID=79884 RepID=UPI00064DC22E|nr:helix-turn-helix domain-containing protein [Alkalihalobacillus pseudalcaliphilus]KMK76902.1 HxlR family transcriptional regulator [Alkalihalobacillus pseudalcaliphilus]